jgi:hypothetical protein
VKITEFEWSLQKKRILSKASSLDKDPIPAYSPENKLSFTGKRIKRGLYKWSKGIINADLNGALNIIRKEVPESLNELIRIRNRGCGFQPFKVLAFFFGRDNEPTTRKSRTRPMPSQ